ncbi:LysR family transcriptional regulator [Methylosinus sp. LW4]|uniref:LysR family transcriptional regulator n=1 Tax=Methylosinus sp. LW4 TaxID=136993 RepID=UPI00037DA27F|nr:LysR family transcriptional regulator [Methylosinus sp. LW4]
MDTSHLDLNLLATLEALLAERNVTKAAARLHLSQPAVSAQLARLRDIFGDPLLLPARRGMIPTARALQMAGPLRDALDQLRYAVQAHQDFDPATAELTVSIACSDYIQAAVIAPLAKASRQRAPGVRIAVRHLAPALMEHQLASGEADLAVATPDATLSHLRSRHLFDETYVLIGRRDHPRLVDGLTIDDYVALEHVVVSRRGGHFRTPVDDALEALGRKRKVVLSAGSFLFVPEIVSESDLVALVPRRLLQRREEQLTIVELPWLGERFEVGMIWHERSHGHAGHRWLRELIVEIAGDRTRTGRPGV